MTKLSGCCITTWLPCSNSTNFFYILQFIMMSTDLRQVKAVHKKTGFWFGGTGISFFPVCSSQFFWPFLKMWNILRRTCLNNCLELPNFSFWWAGKSGFSFFKKGKYRLRHRKNKGVRQSYASSRNSEAVDVWKITRHPPSRRVVACDNFPF